MDRLKFIGNKRGLLEHKSASQSYLITPNCTMKNRRLMEVIHIGNHFKYQVDQCIWVWSMRTKLKSNTEIHLKPCILSDGHFCISIKYWLLRYHVHVFLNFQSSVFQDIFSRYMDIAMHANIYPKYNWKNIYSNSNLNSIWLWQFYECKFFIEFN